MGQAQRKRRTLKGFPEINPDAAGIDVGNAQHYVAVPPGRDPDAVRTFGCFTSDLHALADWLHCCKIKTVAMESTGVYWVALYEVLEAMDSKSVSSMPDKRRTCPGVKRTSKTANGCSNCIHTGC
jgi:transposase